uniref:SGNH hydrolase-type esterase domain-containing protein n=1 Tax=Odontella aurita TaxID=265563 RepID=A0A7S4M5V7_9STRA|mmetsp:Transcript_11777/g.34587  ORF Transcript_11777/g.34587 Transcript_11777/m.34587 type:complete len:247 (+) Transcript_11777:230-970(+)
MRSKILLFGDSITQFGFGADGAFGWVSMLANAYTRRADVLNRGFSGYNTRHALDVLPSVLGEDGKSSGRDTIFCTVFFGANDAALPGTRQHVPIEEYSENIRLVVGNMRANLKGSVDGDDVPIILITPPPVHDKGWERWCTEMGRDKSQRSNEASRAYGEALKSVGTELGCSILDTYSLLEGDKPGFEKHLTDGLHLNGSGNEVIYDGLMNMIRANYPDLAPMEYDDDRPGATGIPMDGKLWQELC